MEPVRIAHENAARIRQAAGGSALAAALMLYFGYSYLAEPTGSDLFSWSAWVLLHTLRIGGISLAVVAIALFAALRTALLADAVVSGVVGAVLILTGIGMVVDGGNLLQTIINVGCGAMFLSAAKHHGREYLSARTTAQAEAHSSEHENSERSRVADPPSLESASAPVAAIPPAPSDINDTHDALRDDTANEETAPPGGFLAALARKNPSEDIEHPQDPTA